MNQHLKELSEEYKALTQAAGLVDYSYRGKIKVGGNDRIRFLHNILTNDIQKLSSGISCESGLLNAQSKLLLYMTVHAFKDCLILDLDKDMAENAVGLLEQRLITEDVQLEDISNHYSHFSLQGPDAEHVLRDSFSGLQPLATSEHRKVAKHEAIVVVTAALLGTIPRYDLWIPREYMNIVLKDIPVRIVSEHTAELVRIEQGVLRYGIDMNEDNMLSETGLEGVAASETKGCYPGQEVVAKIKTYNGLKRKLVRFSFSQKAVLQKMDKIFFEDQEIGWVTSARFSTAIKKGFGLGYISKKMCGSSFEGCIAGHSGLTKAFF